MRKKKKEEKKKGSPNLKKIKRVKLIKKTKKFPKQIKKLHVKAVKKSSGFFSFLFGKKKAKPVIVKKIRAAKLHSMKKTSNHAKQVKSASKSKISKEAHAVLKKIDRTRLIKERKTAILQKRMEMQKKIEVIRTKKLAGKQRQEKKQKLREEKLKAKKEKKLKTLEQKKAANLIKLSTKNIMNGQIAPNFIKTGIEGFDSLFEKGIPEGSSVLVEGGPGSGKTIFCLELAKNMCQKGKKVLYMSFEEPEYRLRNHFASFGTNTAELEKKKLLYIKRFNALDIARSVEALLSEAKKELLIDVQPVLIPHDFTPDIVLIDSLTSIGSAFSGEESRFRIYMEQLFRYLESHQITSFLVRETSNPTHIGTSFIEKAEAVSFLSDGIIALYNVFLPTGQRKRAIEIVKMRGASFDRKIMECEIIGKRGIVVYPNKILTGTYKLT